MTDLNKVVLIGRLTRGINDNERDFAYLSSGQARANISIAVNRSVKRNDQWADEASYFDVTIWGKTAENLKPYLLKGKQVGVEGYLKQDRWEKDGQKFSKVGIVAESVWLLGGKNDGNGNNNGGYNNSNNGYGNNNGYNNNNANNGNGSFTPRNNPPQQQTFDNAGFPEDIPF